MSISHLSALSLLGDQMNVRKIPNKAWFVRVLGQELCVKAFRERTLRGEAAPLSRRALLPWPSRAAHKPATGFVNLVLGSDWGSFSAKNNLFLKVNVCQALGQYSFVIPEFVDFSDLLHRFAPSRLQMWTSFATNGRLRARLKRRHSQVVQPWFYRRQLL